MIVERQLNGREGYLVNSMQRLEAPLEPPPEGELDISLRDLVLPVWHRLWVVALVAVVVVGAVVGFTLTRTPLYEARILVLIGQAQGEASDNLGAEIGGLQQLTLTMAEAVGTRPVAEAAIGKLDLSMSEEGLLKNLEAEQLGSTQFIEVSYRDPDPKRAQQIADAIGEVFSRQVTEVSPSANAITATVWERAAVPESPVSPNLSRTLLLALVVGLMLGVGLAFLLEYLDDRWRSPEEVEQISGVPTFGVIPAYEVSKGYRGA